VPVHDLVVKDGDLVAATHGRSFWILDDISPLRQLSDEVREAAEHLFAPRPLSRFVSSGGFGRAVTLGKNYRYTSAFVVAFRQQEKPSGEKVDKYLDAGQNPPNGVIVHYYLKEKPEGEIKLSFLDANGKEIKTFSSEEKKAEQTGQEEAGAGDKKKKDEKKEPRVPKEAGANRFVWNTRYPDPVKIEGAGESEIAPEGPLAPPGTYQVQLKVGDQTYSESFEILKDPHIISTQEDLQGQFELLLAIRDRVSEAHKAVNAIRDLRKQADDWVRRAQGQDIHEAMEASSQTLKKKLAVLEEELIQVKAKDQLDVLDHPVQLSAKFMALAGVVASADAAPTRQARQVFEELSARLGGLLQRLREVIDTDVDALNKLIRESSLPAIGHVEVEK